MTDRFDEVILDPRGEQGVRDNLTLAPRSGSLAGARIGLLNNSKPNAGALLGAIADLLDDIGEPLPRLVVTKPHFGHPLADDQLQTLTEGCDVVITAIGDCGSCSAATVADGILLERGGVPTATLCTDAFRATADAMASVQGFPGFPYVTIPHPLASVDDEGIRDRARQVLPSILDQLGIER